MTKRLPPEPAPDYFENGKPRPSKKKTPLPVDRSNRTHHRLRVLTDPDATPAPIPDPTNPYDSPAPRKRSHWD